MLLGDLLALSVIDNCALLGGNILAHLILNSVTFPLIDNITLSLSVGGTLLLHDRFTLGLIPGAALLIILHGAFFLMDSLLDSSGNIDTLQLRHIVTDLILFSVALLSSVLSSLAVLLVLESTLLARHSLLDRSLGDLALPLLDIRADLVSYIMALLPGHRLVGGPWNLVTHFLWNLFADWFWSLPLNNGWWIEL